MDAANACAAARAGITRPSLLKCLNFAGANYFGRETLEGVPQVTGHACGIGSGFTGKAKLALLGGAAFADLLGRAELKPAELAVCGFHLNMSDRFLEHAYEAGLEAGDIPQDFPYPAQAWKETANQILDVILRRAAVELPLPNRTLYFGGHAGFAAAIAGACEQIRSGKFRRAVVGAVDSCLEPRFLEAAASIQILKTADNPVGFSPGEGAGFILLEGMSTGVQRKISARVVGTGFAEDNSHQFSEKPAAGSALAGAIQQALSCGSTIAAPSFVVGDLNGSERRALDWGHALLRLRRHTDVSSLPLWLPSVAFGETGAATGALATCLTVRAFERGYAPGSQALVALASDSRERGSLVLAKSTA